MSITNDQQFNRYSIAYFDLSKALEYANEAKNHLPNGLIFEALIFAAIVCYYRPFTPNEKLAVEATSQLKIGEFFGITASERELHERCETLRNKGLAHSEYRFNPTRLNPTSRVVSSKPFSLLASMPDIDKLISLIEKLQLECDKKRAQYVLHGQP